MAEASVGEEETENEPTADSPAPAGKGDWSHPDGKPLEEVEVGSLVDGTVTNSGRYGVFVNFGAVKDALLRVPIKIGKRYKQGMEITGAKVTSCDVEAGKVVLEVDEENWPEAPPPKEKPERGGGEDGSRKGKRDWTHEGATPLEELQEGDVFEGTVTNVSPAGVFVDIGAVRDARLNVKVSIGRRFRIGDVIQNCTIESMDVEAGRMSVGIPDPEAAVADLPPKERAPRAKSKAKSKAKAAPAAKGQAKAKAKATPKGGAKARARSTSQTRQRGAAKPMTVTRTLEEVSEGDVVDGVVVNKSTAGVFVDIGCGKDARLSVPRRVGVLFMIRDVLEGLRVEYVDYERRLISVMLDDPEGAVQNQDRAPPKRSRSVPASSGGGNTGPAGGGTSRAGAQSARGAAPKRGSRSMSPGTRSGGAAGKAKAKAAPPRAAERSSSRKGGKRMSVVDFKAGASVNGVVTKISGQGVHVDIGATSDGLLKLPRAIAKEFRAGDQVHGMSIDIIDKRADLITLSLEEPTLTGTPPPAPNAKSKAKAKAKAASAGGAAAPKSKVAPAGRDWSHPDGLTLEEIKPGEEVDGTVTNVGPFGIFVNVGAVKDARLQVPRADRQRFRKGDRIEGAVVDSVDPASNQLNIVLPFDISEGAEVDRPAPRAKSTGRISSSSPSTQQRPPRAKSVGKARAKAGSAPGTRRPQPRQ